MKFEELTDRNVVYVTRMKKKLNYEILVDCMDMNQDGKMEYREQVVVFRKGDISHIARIITYVDIKKGKQPKLISLLTNDFDMPLETIVAIYRRRWQIESLFKQIKQNFPLRYFYGESANAIKIQIWVTGHIDSKPAAVVAPKLSGTELELLRIGYDGKNCTYVLSEPAYFLQSARR